MRHLALPVLASAQLAAPAPNSVIVFRDVTVIPMTQAAPLLRQSVLVRQGTIAEIGPTARLRPPAGGIEALDQLARDPASLEWVRARTAALDSLARPQGLLRISVIPAVKHLVRGAGGPVP